MRNSQSALNKLFQELLLTNKEKSITIQTESPGFVVGRMLHLKFEHAKKLQGEERISMQNSCVRYKVSSGDLTLWLVDKNDL